MNNNPFSYSGKIGRLSFFITTIILSVIRFILSGIIIGLHGIYEKSLVHNHDTGNLGFIAFLFCIPALIVLILEIFAWIKRCRDANISTNWIWLIIVPIAGFIYWIYLLIKPSYKNMEQLKDSLPEKEEQTDSANS